LSAYRLKKLTYRASKEQQLLERRHTQHFSHNWPLRRFNLRYVRHSQSRIIFSVHKPHNNLWMINQTRKMTSITLNMTIVLSNHDDKLSTCSIEDDDSWDGASFSGDSFSEDSFDDDVDAKEGQGMEISINCIDDALAFLSGDDEDHSEREIDLPEVLLRRALRFDSPPSHPHRSFKEVGLKLRQLQSKQSESGQDRFELSHSEHVSKSLCPPSRPSRPSESREKNDTPPIPTVVTDQEAPPRRPGLTRAQSVHVVSSRRPPARTGSKKPRRCSNSATLGSSQHLHSEHGQVTLRASAHRVLMGTWELSTSQHLRRNCPGRAQTSN
jgi:hypothetical protein